MVGKGHFGEVKAIQNSVKQNPTSAAVCRSRVFDYKYAMGKSLCQDFFPRFLHAGSVECHVVEHVVDVRRIYRAVAVHICGGDLLGTQFTVIAYSNVCHIVQNVVDVGGINITVLVNIASNYIGRLCHSAVSKMNRSSYYSTPKKYRILLTTGL